MTQDNSASVALTEEKAKERKREQRREIMRRFKDRHGERFLEKKREYDRLYKQRDPEKWRKYARLHRQKNIEKAKESGRLYHIRNRDKRNAATREWYRKNRDELCKAERERRAALRRTLHGRSRILCYQKRTHCKNKGIEFSITPEWIEQKLGHGRCEVTGIELDFSSKRGPFSPSLDRKDPSGGYTAENTQVVVWSYNAAKGTWSHDEVMKLAEALVNKAKE